METQIIEQKLKDVCSDARLYYKNHQAGGVFHIFFVAFPSQDLLKQYWEEAVSLVAVNFQDKLDNDFEIWNIYMVFFTPDPCRKEVKYLIENDRFSCRKLIFQSTQGNTDVVQEEIIKSKIFGVPVLGDGNQSTFLQVMPTSSPGHVHAIISDDKYVLKGGQGSAKTERLEAYKALLKLYNYEI